MIGAYMKEDCMIIKILDWIPVVAVFVLSLMKFIENDTHNSFVIFMIALVVLSITLNLKITRKHANKYYKLYMESECKWKV